MVRKDFQSRIASLRLPAALAAGLLLVGCEPDEPSSATEPELAVERSLDPKEVARGREIFRFDTFGNETFWTDTLEMHDRVEAVVSPRVALQVGLKVDAEALPADLKAALAAGDVDLDAPATTVALLGLDAVLGIRGTVDGDGKLTRLGVTCALCHSTVDNSFAPGIGRRLDGWPNRDLDVGAIVALSNALTPAQRKVYESWGAGMYDPRFNVDGINLPVVLPPAFGLRHVAREVYTGDGPVSYWNAYVAITQMHGHGRFVDQRIGVAVENPPDLVSSKLAALRAYQFSLDAPEAPRGSVKGDAARRGRKVFREAGCASCHAGPSFTDVNRGKLHPAAEVGQDPRYAARSATGRYRTTPLRGLWNPPQLVGPYFHDGSAKTLDDVVEHYVRLQRLRLTEGERRDLIAFLKTL